MVKSQSLEKLKNHVDVLLVTTGRKLDLMVLEVLSSLKDSVKRILNRALSSHNPLTKRKRTWFTKKFLGHSGQGKM